RSSDCFPFRWRSSACCFFPYYSLPPRNTGSTKWNGWPSRKARSRTGAGNAENVSPHIFPGRLAGLAGGVQLDKSVRLLSVFRVEANLRRDDSRVHVPRGIACCSIVPDLRIHLRR